jgi:hypothetical protein
MFEHSARLRKLKGDGFSRAREAYHQSAILVRLNWRLNIRGGEGREQFKGDGKESRV